MHRGRSPTIAGLALAAMAAAGCGEDPHLEQGPVPFKGTDTSSFAPLRDEMMKKMRDQSHPERAGPEPAAGPGASSTPAPAPATKGP
jgi:hypothetical protein